MTSQKTHTYRCGERLELEKNPHQFVVRTLPKVIDHLGWSELEQVSSASTRVTIARDKLEESMNRSRGIAPTHHAYRIYETGEEWLVTDRVFVRFKRNPQKLTLNKFMAKYGLIYKTKYSTKEYLLQLTNHTGMNPLKLVVHLTEKDALIESAGHDVNRLLTKYELPIPSDPSYLQQWHLHDRLNDSEFDIRATSRTEEAWDLLNGRGNPDVVVAITDDGCQLNHADFDSPNKFVDWGYFEGQSLITKRDVGALSSKMYKPGSNHGTSCAGVTAGEVDALKTVGVAPNCSLLPIKWESSGPSLYISDSKLITALNFIADKADIMSNSWGSSPSGIWENEVINRITSLTQTEGRHGKGMVILWAAGNENCPIEHVSNKDIPYDSGVEVNQGVATWVGVRKSKSFRHNLVDIEGVMFVAALASTAKRSHYSNYGPGLSICAPTNNAHKYHRMMVDGLGITTTTGQGTGVTASFGGTSSATPLVAGVAALVMSANPDLSASEVISILKTSASKDLSMEGYPITPPASFDPDTSWDISPVEPFENGDFQEIGSADGTWSPWFGHGKVDAFEAVKQALSIGGGEPGEIFERSSSPGIVIPDNDPVGVLDGIHCDRSGKLLAIEIGVKIIHSYIGDLVLSLISPSQKEIVLHNRKGGSRNNIEQVFNVSNSAQILQLSDQSVQGEWKLHVRDLALRDVGILENWNLRIEMESGLEVFVDDQPASEIPDNQSGGVTRKLEVAQSGVLREIEVSIDITHTFIGDLTVELISPTQESIMLHDRTGSYRDNIITTFTSQTNADLANVLGTEIQGDWKLKVIDHANWDSGKLNYWALKMIAE